MTEGGKIKGIDLSWVCERDIDLLLLEEFVASPDFLAWFLHQLGMEPPFTLISVACSVSTTTGESDLEITIQHGDEVVKLLIEDKIGAPLQQDQAMRYRERAAMYVKNRKCSNALTVIIAPEEYFGRNDEKLGFDRRVNHEAVLKWFEGAKELKSRQSYKLALLRAAIEHGTLGWKLVPDRVITEFWREYWKIADSHWPELRMRKPQDKPATSSFIYFSPLGLAKNVVLVHKVPYGNVDLQFGGMGERIGDLERLYRARLEAEMRIDRAAKSGVIRIRVPEIDMASPFSVSEPAVREALGAASWLLSWYRQFAK